VIVHLSFDIFHFSFSERKLSLLDGAEQSACNDKMKNVK